MPRLQPTATYRLQFNSAFRLSDARSILPYLQRLGISHLYCSPILRARSGSAHGYDVVDPRSLNPELGSEDDLRSLAHDAEKRGMGIVLDIVPNHMATGEENPYWEDVLQHGPSSEYARWFDIDWDAAGRRVFLPVLGKRLGHAIGEGELVPALVDGRFRIRYYEQSFPIDPATLPLLFDLLAGMLPDWATSEPARAIERTLDRLRRMHSKTAAPAAGFTPRQRIADDALAALHDLLARSPNLQARTRHALTAYSRPPQGHGALRRLLDAQPYRLAYWRRAAREINYRRFFTISHLVAVRQEDPEVFRATHEHVLHWIREGLVHGLRIDHIDGLLDPTGYLEQLHRATIEAVCDESTPGIPIYVEKILAPTERLPSSWPVAGTTGYDFLNLVEDVFVDPDGLESLEKRYRRMVGRGSGFLEVAREAKRRILQGHLAADVRRLTNRLDRLLQLLPGRVSWNRRELARGIVEVIVHLDVYRVYYDGSTGKLTAAEREYIQAALSAARENGRTSPDCLQVLEDILLPPVDSDVERSSERIAFVHRFQQLAVPAAAKGVEDTAFYVHVPLLSRIEVGADPQHPLREAVLRLHEENAVRASERPQTMLCVTTHDSKRSADIRARLDVLTELPEPWTRSVRRWRRWNRRLRKRVRGRYVPDANTEYLLYQTLLGMWPLVTDDGGSGSAALATRLEEYMLKAVREAKVHTSWVEPDSDFENTLAEFIAALFRSEDSRFLRDLEQFAARMARPGLWNSLARTLIQLTAPGLPDLYQGDELWNLSLVDPDNRREVDYAVRVGHLEEVDPDPTRRGGESPRFLSELVEHAEDGRLKLYVIHRALTLRRREPLLFGAGSYQALPAEGPAAEHVVAFARLKDSHVAVTVVPRLPTRLQWRPDHRPSDAQAWGDTAVVLPPPLRRQHWQCVLTGRAFAAPGDLYVADLLSTLPVALLVPMPMG